MTGAGAGAGISNNLRGVLWMVAATIVWAALAGFIRLASETVHPFQIAFLRAAFALPLVMAWQVRDHGLRLPVRHFGRHVLRAALFGATMLCLFSALAMAPLALVTAIVFTAPLFTTIGAAALLGETVGWRRWMAVAVGFAGVLVVVRPTGGSIELGVLLALAAAVLAAGDWLVLKPLAQRLPAPTVVLWVTVLSLPVTLIPALTVWQTPDLVGLGWVVAVAVAGTCAQGCVTRAMALADLSLLGPLSFLELVFVAVIGWLAFDERLAWTTAVGAAVIVASSAYVAQREARRPRPVEGSY